MVLHFIDKKIRDAFSDAAMQYDAIADLHKEIGRELVKKLIPLEDNKAILDIGMGTGWLTKKIKFYFPQSLVVGMDFSPGMIKVAQEINEGFQIVQADAAALPFRDKSIDLIVSNLAFQWVKNVSSSFRLCHQLLNSPGTLSLTMFGHDTFQELFIALEKTKKSSDEINSLPIQRLVKVEQVRGALIDAGFKDFNVDYERIKVRFPDMMGLIKWTKDIGANALPKENLFIGKEWLARANDYYDKNFKDRLGTYATFEVIWCEARK